MAAELALLALGALAFGAGGDAPAGPVLPASIVPPDRMPMPAQDDELITMQMLAAPAPLPNTTEDTPGEWQRIVKRHTEVPRSETQGGAALSIWPIMAIDLAATEDRYIVARLWMESDIQVATDDHDARASTWSFAMPLTPGAQVLPVGSTNQGVFLGAAIPNAGRPPIDWLYTRIRLDIGGRLEVYAVYPGKAHTGKNRGRIYDAVFEYLTLPSMPT